MKYKHLFSTSYSRKIFDEYYGKSNKRWINRGSEFYKNTTKSWLQVNNVNMNSIYNEGKCLAAERFIRTFKTKKIYKFDNTVDKHNNTCYRTGKIKSTDANSNSNFHLEVESHDASPIFVVCDLIRISKHKNIIANSYTTQTGQNHFFY